MVSLIAALENSPQLSLLHTPRLGAVGQPYPWNLGAICLLKKSREAHLSGFEEFRTGHTQNLSEISKSRRESMNLRIPRSLTDYSRTLRRQRFLLVIPSVVLATATALSLGTFRIWMSQPPDCECRRKTATMRRQTLVPLVPELSGRCHFAGDVLDPQRTVNQLLP